MCIRDSNIAPDAIDVHDPDGLLGHVCYHPEVHRELKSVMEWGFIDVFRLHHKESGQYTFWPASTRLMRGGRGLVVGKADGGDYRPLNAVKKNLGWRLDHIMATKPLSEKSIACYIDKAPRLLPRPSDHTPIIAEFNL